MKIKAVIFDYDGTLVDSSQRLTRSLEQTFRKMNVSVSASHRENRVVQKSLREYFPDLFGENWRKAAEVFYQFYAKNLQYNSPFHETEEILKLLLEKGLYVAIVSNKRGDILRSEVNELMGWGKYFKKIVGAGDAKYDKPSAFPVELALEDLQYYKHHQDGQVLFVGDTITDIECAANSRCIPILIGEGKDVVNKDQLDHKFDTHAELLKYFRELLCA